MFRGVAENNAWGVAANSIYVSFTQGKTLREAIKDTRVDVLGERPSKFYIGSGQDATTRATDFNATAGRNFTLYSKNLTVVGDDPSVDVTLTSVFTGAVTKLDNDMIVLNEPSRLILLLSAGLDDGEYTLTVTTQYKGSSNDLLKTFRSASQTLYIGGVPDSGSTVTLGGGGGGDEITKPLG